MTHTEEELRAVLAERVPGGPPDMREIVRRGRGIRRRRAVAGVALAGAAAITVAFPAQGLWTGLEPVEKKPPMTAAVSPSSALPPENRTPTYSAPLIASYGSTTMPAGTTVTFQPLSLYTSYKVVCADPKALVVIRSARGGSVSSCGKDGANVSSNKESASPDWLERPQSFKVWVLPGDRSTRRAGPLRTAYDGCKVARKELGLCDGKYVMAALLRPGVIERLTAELGRRPGRWEVGVYDRAGLTAPPWPIPTRTVTVEPDDRTGTTARPEPIPTRTVTVEPDDRVGATAPPKATPTRTVTVKPDDQVETTAPTEPIPTRTVTVEP
ncbi:MULTISPECIES: hypothetical protein [unclassified Streptosporangium]|uniref:hypothetical protein n=1 Tax=unclassified Streptosporangium TaxID=2632669 RepID=UPI002E2B9339|nr:MULTISPECIES: hypothetical protein [unclassified Streptosporangium]